MNKKKTAVKLPTGLLWTLTILVWILFIIWSLDLIGHYEPVFSSLLMLAGLLLCWTAFIMDMISSEIYNKPAWIIMVIIIPLITFPLYLFQKKRLIDLYRKKQAFTQKEDNEN